jgi:hypothetical protein
MVAQTSDLTSLIELVKPQKPGSSGSTVVTTSTSDIRNPKKKKKKRLMVRASDLDNNGGDPVARQALSEACGHTGMYSQQLRDAVKEWMKEEKGESSTPLKISVFQSRKKGEQSSRTRSLSRHRRSKSRDPTGRSNERVLEECKKDEHTNTPAQRRRDRSRSRGRSRAPHAIQLPGPLEKTVSCRWGNGISRVKQ